MQRPNLDPKHFEEFVKGSGINCQLVALNFSSLEGNSTYDYLFISNRLPRTNTGMIRSDWLRRYHFITLGGWWCSGRDPLNPGELMEWGCFKPNYPRQNPAGKVIKYEHPPLIATRIFCLRITLKIWQKIAVKYNCLLPESIKIEHGEALGFWQWILQNNLPLIICEGVKKAAALLTLGYPAIALPGITSGYRVRKDEKGRTVGRKLIPELAIFAQTSRCFYICFDYENKLKTQKIINSAITHLGELLEAENCAVKVIHLPGPEKGVDEMIVAQGEGIFETLYQQSFDLETYLAKIKPHSQLTYRVNLTINSRYLGEISLPKTGLIGIKSPKGTGKTTALLKPVQQALENNQPVLLLTHRIQLGRFLCDKIGVQWINQDYSEVPKKLDFKNRQPSKKSLGLCLDSLGKLNPDEWQGAIVILDEVEQSIWHLLNSATCKEKRVKLLKNFQKLINLVLQTDGLVIAQDADLSDLSLDYLKALTSKKIEPWIICNQWQPENFAPIDFYEFPNPIPLIAQLEEDLKTGLKCYITTDSRSGQYSCETIEYYIKQRFQNIHQTPLKTLIISSTTTHTPNHEAVGFIAAINQKIYDYDAVFVTPSVGTGVSIDVEHFDRVYGIFQGVIPDEEARQALARVRANIPRLIWCAKRGISFIGSGSKNYRVLADWYQVSSQENLALINPLYPIDVDLPFVCDFINLRCWAKLAARVNASLCFYRPSMLEGLLSEGYQVNRISQALWQDQITDLRKAFLSLKSEDFNHQKQVMLELFALQRKQGKQASIYSKIKNEMQQIQQKIQWQTAEKIAQAKDLNIFEYDRIRSKHSLTNQEHYQLQKYGLKQRYGIPITPELVLKDQRGYYTQILTHYYLTYKTEFFQLKDQQEWQEQLLRGEGQIFLPDLDIYTLKIEVLRTLGITKLLENNRIFQENDSDLIFLKKQVLQYAQPIKRATNISLPADINAISTITILRQIFRLLGLKLKRISKSKKHYQIAPETINDGRLIIFTYWQSQEKFNLIPHQIVNSQALQNHKYAGHL